MQINVKIGINIFRNAVLIFAVASPFGAWAQDANSRTVEQYGCKDVMLSTAATVTSPSRFFTVTIGKIRPLDIQYR